MEKDGWIAENLGFLRRHHKFSQQEMADALGIKRSSLSAYELGRSEPAVSLLRKYAEHFNISLGELLDPELKSTYLSQKDKAPQSTFKILALTVDDQQRENIELVNEKAAAGYTYGYGDPEFVRNLPRFQLPWLKNGTFRAFQIEGDSMLPIVSGSIIVGEYQEKVKDVKKGDPCIFVTANNGILFKRVAELSADKIVLKSDNPSFASYSLPLSEIQEVWKAKLYMSSNFA